MKRYDSLFEKICSLENIELAHEHAKKGKTHYSAVKLIESDRQYYFNEIKKLLESKMFHTAQYTKLIKNEYGKVRVIHKLPYYPDRIIHHAIVQIVGKIWDKTMIRDTYACIKHRGIHDVAKRLKQALKDTVNTKYCLKMDARKFYPSMDHDILKSIIRKKIKDSNLLELLDEIIDSLNSKSGIGVPIGNYLSQFFGNLYLTGYDHYMKEMHGCHYYFRYCDDVVILDASKNRLHKLRWQTQQYWANVLNLILKKNWQVFPVDVRGIDFLGYRFFHQYTLLRKSIGTKFKIKMDIIKNNWADMTPISVVSSIMSYRGWMKYADCHNLQHKHIDDQVKEILTHNQAVIKIANIKIRSN